MTQGKHPSVGRPPLGTIAAALVLVLAPALGDRRALSDEPAPTGASSSPELVTRGSSPWLSPSGRHLAFRRTGLDLEARDWRGQPKRHGILRVRDLEAGTEARAGRNGRVTGWSGDELLILDDASSVRVAGRGDEPKFPDTTADLHTPAWTRSRDGQRVAYTVRGFTEEDMTSVSAPKGREHTIHVVGPDAPARPLDLGAHVNHDEAGGLLAFSPSGRHLAFRVGFMANRGLPHPRVGVFDLETNACTFVAEEAYGSRDRWSDDVPRGPTAWAAWDRGGTRFVFVKAAGAKKRDVYTVTADGRDLRRLTDDTAWKAAPCLDPAGERCAYWVMDTRPAPAPAEDDGPRRLFAGRGESGPHRLRVVMLTTGGTHAVETPGRGAGSDLQWTPDGRHLVFGWRGADGSGVWRVAAPPAPTVPPDTPVVNLTDSVESALVEALTSEDEDEAEAALRHAWANEDPRVTSAMVAMVRRWAPARNPGGMWQLPRALAQRRAVGAIPVLLDALSNAEWADAITRTLLDWDVEAGVPHWRRLARLPRGYPRGWATVALARFGDDAAWELVRERLTSEGTHTRDAIVLALGHVRDARSVETLVTRLEDDGLLYRDVVVGDHAAESLERLTRQRFGRDRERWEAWWASAGKTLPSRGEAER